VAVYLVLLFHTGLAAAGGGFIGVDLFFVLSGFLVSNVILSEVDESGRLQLGRFYARRVRRLLPAALVVIVATSAMFLLVASVVRRLPIVVDAQSALLYVANWRFLFQQNDYFAADVEASPFLHFWSLAIEEQFYVVFPILLVLTVRAARRRSWVLPTVFGGLFVLSLAAQLYWAQVDVSWAYYGTDARLYQLLAGVLLALALRTAWRPAVLPARAAAPLGLALLLVLGSGLVSLTPSWRGIGATVASVLVIGGLMVADTGVFARLLSRRTPVYLGQISYGTYLWHWPVILVIEELLAVRPLVLAGLAVALSSGLAALSFQVLEHPIRSAPLLRPFRWRIVGVGVLSSVLVAVTVVPMLLESDRRPRLAAAAAAPGSPMAAPASGVDSSAGEDERSAPIPEGIDWEALRRAPETGPPCTPKDPTACVLVDGKGPHVTLVGDSQAGMLVPMFRSLAEEHDLRLSVNTVPACSWRAGTVNKRVPKAQNDRCEEMRQDWYDVVLPKGYI
jgi:peptidoglycan/LPS O-acetylase OafA/YrhL